MSEVGRGESRRLPLSLRYALYVLVPLGCFGSLTGGLYAKRVHDLARAKEASESVMQTQLQKIGELEEAIARLALGDPARAPLEAELAREQAKLEATQTALRQTSFVIRGTP